MVGQGEKSVGSVFRSLGLLVAIDQYMIVRLLFELTLFWTRGFRHKRGDEEKEVG